MQINKINRPFLAVRAIITNETGQVLILKRSKTIQGNDKWCLPGGNIEYGQTVDEAVAVEVLEETALICKSLKFLFYFENLPSQESELHYVNLVFKCHVEGKIQLNSESSSFVWIVLEELKNYEFAFRNNEILEEYWAL